MSLSKRDHKKFQLDAGDFLFIDVLNPADAMGRIDDKITGFELVLLYRQRRLYGEHRFCATAGFRGMRLRDWGDPRWRRFEQVGAAFGGTSFRVRTGDFLLHCCRHVKDLPSAGANQPSGRNLAR